VVVYEGWLLQEVLLYIFSQDVEEYDLDDARQRNSVTYNLKTQPGDSPDFEFKLTPLNS
jgi:hypothetical protein